MNTNPIHNTHPMVLIAAVALTIFSVLGGAAILGFIPSANSERVELPQVATADNGSQPTIDSSQPTEEPPAVTGKRVLAQPKTTASEPSHYASRNRSVAASNKPVMSCSTCGVIESIRMVQHDGEGSGLGAVAGGVAGGVVGNQIGNGKGNTLMTILGIGGGAYAGHTIEKKMKKTTSYLVKIRMEDGTYRTITQYNQPEYAVGDHVKLVSGHLTLA